MMRVSAYTGHVPMLVCTSEISGTTRKTQVQCEADIISINWLVWVTGCVMCVNEYDVMFNVTWLYDVNSKGRSIKVAY